MGFLALELVGSLVEFDFSAGMKTLGELLFINGLWSQEFSDSLKFWIKPPRLWVSVLLGEHSSNAPASTALAALDFSANIPQCG